MLISPAIDPFGSNLFEAGPGPGPEHLPVATCKRQRETNPIAIWPGIGETKVVDGQWVDGLPGA